ncbi:YrdB family protein [Streptomyces sp. NPDC051569]|uniref:YrdB family protein n=1 Tax=Streptomyces sp. NPDC051569 TaxID=3365661 RepID=UPI0037A4F39B
MPLDDRPWYVANEVLAFVLELVALGVLAWWGTTVGGNAAVSALLAVGTPLLAAVLWGLCAAPRAKYRPPLPGVLAVKALVLLGAACALWSIGHPAAAAVLAVVVVANTATAEVFRKAV